MDFHDLAPLLAAGSDLDALVELLAGLTDKERKACSGPSLEAAAYGPLRLANQSAIALTLLGCGTGVRQVTSGLQWLSIDAEALPLATRVLRDRNPSWLAQFPTALMEIRDVGPDARRLVRHLVRDGLVPAPDLAAYQAGLAYGLMASRPDPVSVLDALADDPGILDHELWDMLACEGAGAVLASVDQWLARAWVMPGQPPAPVTPERTWQHALVTLSSQEIVDRHRLLNETLTACLRDWKASDSAWYLSLHDALAPTLDEAHARESVYLRLLAAEPGRTVSLAQRQLTRLLESDRADLPALIEGSDAALSRPDKGPVIAQLRLLQAAAGREPSHRSGIAVAVRTALSHTRTDVQERALRVLGALVPDPEERATLMGRHVETLAPTLRLGLGATGSTTARSPGDGDQAPVVRQPDPEPVVPILDADELADVLSQLIEEAADPVEVERALEAVARLAGTKPRSGGDVLARRAQTLLGERDPGPWTGEDVRADLAALTLVWLARGSAGHGPKGRVVDHQMRSNRFVSIFSPDWTLSSLVTRRIHEIAIATAKGGATLLSLPTRRDGSIDRATMLARVRCLSRTARPLPLDVGVAALRLSPADDNGPDLPGAHRAARALAAHLETLESHHARWEPVLGTSRSMYGPTLERGATWRDAASSKGSTTDAVAAVLDRHDPLRRFGLETQDGEYGGRFEQVTALWPLLLPHHPELLAAHAHARLNRALTKNRHGTGPLLDALARTRTPTGPVVCSSMTLGLSAKNGDERTEPAPSTPWSIWPRRACSTAISSAPRSGGCSRRTS